MFAEVENQVEYRFVLVVLVSFRATDFYQIHDILVFQ